VRVASGWIDTGNYNREGLLLELTAPATYGYAPTRIQFLIFIPEVSISYGSQATAHSIAAEHAATHDLLTPQSVTSSVADCLVAAEPAAVFGYVDGNERGYRLSVVHKDFLLEIWLSGAGGVSNQAIQDALGMMTSITWTF